MDNSGRKEYTASGQQPFVRQDQETEAFLLQADRPPGNLFTELVGFLAHNKKWWLGPIILVLLLMSLLVVLAGSALAPFIYTVF